MSGYGEVISLHIVVGVGRVHVYVFHAFLLYVAVRGIVYLSLYLRGQELARVVGAILAQGRDGAHAQQKSPPTIPGFLNPISL